MFFRLNIKWIINKINKLRALELSGTWLYHWWEDSHQNTSGNNGFDTTGKMK